MSSLLKQLNGKFTAKEYVIEQHELTVEFVRNAQPTKTGLKRKLIRFKELDNPVFVLENAINGIIKPGAKANATLQEKGDYINILAVDGEREAWHDKLEQCARLGVTVSI